MGLFSGLSPVYVSSYQNDPYDIEQFQLTAGSYEDLLEGILCENGKHEQGKWLIRRFNEHSGQLSCISNCGKNKYLFWKICVPISQKGV